MSELSERPVTYHELPLPRTLQLLRVENLTLSYQASRSLDIGSLCYLRRSGAQRKPGRGRKADLSSYCDSRASQIRNFIQVASDFVSSSGFRLSTIFDLHSAFVRFLDWCDKNSHESVLSNSDEAKAAFRSYRDHLQDLVNQNELHVNTAADYQNNVIKVMDTHFGFEHVSQGIHLIVRSKHLAQPIPVPHEDSQAKVLAWCICLFSGLSELVLDRKPYPFSLSLPTYLNWPQDRLWIFPLRRWCEPAGHLNRYKIYMAYDFQNGCVRNREQVEALFGKTDFTANTLKRANKRVTEANEDNYDYSRVDRAELAMQAFFLMFIAATGMNLTQAAELAWSEDLNDAVRDPLIERQGFRTVKYRANNRLVSFELGIQYIPYLRRYLELRAYHLNGRTSRFLFHRGKIRPGVIDEDVSGQSKDRVQGFFLVLRRLCPSIPKVLPRHWRAAKQDYVIRHYDPAVAATAMQHSEATALKHYSNGSETVQNVELRSYLLQVEQVVVQSGKPSGANERSPIGACSKPSQPHVISPLAPVKPDCRSPEGCLFCDKYRIHADKADIRKLLSARFFLRKVGSTASNHEQFHHLFGGVLQRIEAIVDDLRKHDEPVVKEVIQEVDIEGELDVYWSAKMDLLVELEIL